MTEQTAAQLTRRILVEVTDEVAQECAHKVANHLECPINTTLLDMGFDTAFIGFHEIAFYHEERTESAVVPAEAILWQRNLSDRLSDANWNRDAFDPSAVKGISFELEVPAGIPIPEWVAVL